MPLFKCSNCGAVENTALGSFWWRKDNPICSECETGAWHGCFLKKDATKDGYYKGEDGCIYHPNEVDQEKMEWKYNRDFKMVGLA